MLHIKNKLLKFGAIATTIVSLYSCEKKAEQTISKRQYQMVWNDEFNGAAGTTPDTSKWVADIGTGNLGWGNSELQYYTKNGTNVQQNGNGYLNITAIKENYAGSGFTSARIKTQGKFSYGYGRYEARIKTPTGPGVWPAFWMLGDNINTVSWPQCGEIDILEQKGNQSYITYGTVHGPGYAGGNSIGKSYALQNGRFDADYHIYAVEWGADYVDFFVDDYLYQRVTPNDVTGEWVYNHNFFIILNVAVGGNFVGFPTTGTPFPQTMSVDYVRVYKQI
ncbi:MAG: glycoside hydrolase family 16 protein [Bacteroidetes bacterium]|nr:glycoside hydrolase family 16 protein [Bacteroidota bacterium]